MAAHRGIIDKYMNKNLYYLLIHREINYYKGGAELVKMLFSAHTSEAFRTTQKCDFKWSFFVSTQFRKTALIYYHKFSVYPSWIWTYSHRYKKQYNCFKNTLYECHLISHLEVVFTSRQLKRLGK